MYDEAIADRVLRILRQIPHEGATRAELLSHMKGYSTDKRDLSHTLAVMRRTGQIKFKQKPGSRSNRLGTWHYVPLMDRTHTNTRTQPRQESSTIKNARVAFDYEPPALVPSSLRATGGDVDDVPSISGNRVGSQGPSGLVPLIVGVAIGGITGILMVLGYLAL